MKWLHEHAEWTPVVLRVFFGFAFLIAGLDKILSLQMARGMFEGFFGPTLGAPLLYLAIAIELLGGIALLLNWHAACAATVLTLFMIVALVKTFKLGVAPNIIGTLREMFVMNTGGGNTAVNFAYIAGLLAIAFSGCEQCRKRK